MKRKLALLACGCVSAATSALAAGSCIISAPAENLRYSAASPAMAFVTGGYTTAPGAAQALEARYRALANSAGVALLTDKGRFGAILIIR